VPRIDSPQTLFDTLTGCIGTPTGNPQLAARRKFECHVMDSIHGQAKQLSARLGAPDRATLDQFLTGVEDLEKRCSASTRVAACTPPARPGAGVVSYQADLELMLDLAVLAFQCDLTRVATFMIGSACGYRNFTFVGAGAGDPHDMTHNGDNADWAKITTWTFAQYAYLLGKMQGVQEAGATLLDNSIVYIGSEFNDGSVHDSTNLPVIVAGKAGGLYRPGRFVTLPLPQPRANLYLTFLHDMGATGVTSFGDSTGDFTGLRG
jgi:hypothetical protein